MNNMEPQIPDYPPKRVKLIFNPISGAPGDSPGQLLAIITAMQALNIVPEVHLIEPGSDLSPVILDALRRGFREFLVSGGDGTIDSVASILCGTRATLAVIPTGTQNNVALSLDIPADIPSAVGLLRTGDPIRVDMGIAECGEEKRPFLEGCTVGLISALFPAADDIQHGNLARIGDLLATLVSFPVADMHLVLDSNKIIDTQGHVLLAANMPYLGPHYQVTSDRLFNDGLLDVMVFANLTKLDLIGTVIQTVGGGPEDPRIRRYRVRQLEVYTRPPMPVLADGFDLGEGPLRITMRRNALRLIAGKPSSGKQLPGANVVVKTPDSGG